MLQHLEAGRISLLDAAIHDFLCLIADHRTGVSLASAEKIRALCPSDVTLRAIQRSLARLEEIAWIKRFRTRGQRGNYPVAIGKFYVLRVTHPVTDKSPTWMSVNLDRTVDWRDVQFELVTDPSFIRDVSCHRPVTGRGTDVSPVQEGRSREGRKKKRTSDGVRRSVGRFSPKTREQKLRDGLVRKVQKTGESLQDCFNEELPDWWDGYLQACRFVGYEPDKSDPTLTISWAAAMSRIWEKHNPENRGTYDPISPGIFATKVIDELMRDRELFPPSFVEHRKQLREVERLEEVQR